MMAQPVGHCVGQLVGLSWKGTAKRWYTERGHVMAGQLIHRITVAEYLATRGMPASWRYASPYGRTVAATYRTLYRAEPGKALLFINGKFRPVMAYAVDEVHVLDAAWDLYLRTAPLAGSTPEPSATDLLFASLDLIEPGELVLYHGSKTGEHGLFLATPCECRHCFAGDQSGDTDTRYRLQSISTVGRDLVHARRDSVTAARAIVPPL